MQHRSPRRRHHRRGFRRTVVIVAKRVALAILSEILSAVVRTLVARYLP